MFCCATKMFIQVLATVALIRPAYSYAFTLCENDEFQCTDGACISRSWRCDGENDCPDKSDELYCEGSGVYAYCPDRSYFRCSGSHCIPRAWVCDGIRDCDDAKDEDKCTPSYCDQPGMFTCNNKHCIPKSAVCDGKYDCKDHSDEANCFTGVLAVPGVEASRTLGITRLKSKRNWRWGWDKNSHRAVVALYLSGGATFNGMREEEELMAKQLELEVALALLRNETEPLRRNRLALYINAMLVTCHNPRNFYGFDLVSLLKNTTRMKENTTHPIVYLALCNAKEGLSDDAVNRLFSVLEYESEYHFWIDIQAMAVVALSCITNQSTHAHLAPNITSITENFKRKQRADGSFGNVHTSALVIQALLSSGHEEDSDWDVSGAVKYLQSEQTRGSRNTSPDLFASYLILPILKGKTLADIAHVKCHNVRRPPDNSNSIADIKNQLGPKMYIQYSLYIGNAKDVVHTLSLRVPANITVYDVMRLAADTDHKYIFEYKKTDDNTYVYSIADIANDSENGFFWLLYLNKDPALDIKSPDKMQVKDGDHIVMWYRTLDLDP